ncbi:hypothetical protein G6321_00051150 [Bradyrhizobium barranii subsp. barranii]|uniref:Uncharacterized protein n=1 Tax=Bradyrhizobium barranii subsp. barranii TaxID=2823807 RepID=A0A9X9YSD9_9BRAD|nr:hypothetical protein [Bradyrhizobium barranii]UGX93844.1 hypothetical protein G6321_00051150 [Bradyrhizobium barranii subsp. barranii]
MDGKPLVTAGGRGRNAPTMSRRDAATLICALMGSEAVHDSVRTVEWMRELEPASHGYRWNGRYGWVDPEFEIGIRPEDNAIEALERVLGFFDREKAYRLNLDRFGRPDAEIYFRFYVEFPQRFVSLTFGVRRMVSAAWTYGRRSGGRDKQARWCEQDELREIAGICAPSGGQ